MPQRGGLTLAFSPHGDHHAVVEADLVIEISPPITHAVRTKLKENRGKWKSFLPAVVEPTTLNVHVTPRGSRTPRSVPASVPPPPLEFVRYKADGRIDWRLSVDGAHITINCLAYTRWRHVWKQARRLFADGSEVLPEPTVITAVALQCINVFSWDGPTEDYDARQLLDGSSSSVPASVLDHGPLWHLHQGWFEPHLGPPKGRVLRRMHIDAIADEVNEYRVKFENLQRLIFAGDGTGRQARAVFSATGTLIDDSFAALHDLAKRSLRNYLTEDVQRTLNLHAD